MIMMSTKLTFFNGICYPILYHVLIEKSAKYIL